MAKLIYLTPTSLDGYIADETGNPDWSAPDEEGFAFISDLLRPIGMYLYGRKMYETMAIWETPDVIPGRTPAMLDFARIWQAADKIVYSKSLETVSTPKTRLERTECASLLRCGLRRRNFSRWHELGRPTDRHPTDRSWLLTVGSPCDNRTPSCGCENGLRWRFYVAYRRGRLL